MVAGKLLCYLDIMCSIMTFVYMSNKWCYELYFGDEMKHVVP
jgi:hypothetical protein